MTQTSPILALPYLMPSQAQKHVTHNEALQLLDALVQLSVQGFDAATPPASPAPGETHALGAAPQAAWAGHAGKIAVWQGEGWLFVAPCPAGAPGAWRMRSCGSGTAAPGSCRPPQPRIWPRSGWAPPRMPPTRCQRPARQRC